jgi:hypothetical protein
MTHSVNTFFSSTFWVFVFTLVTQKALSQDSLFCSLANNNPNLWNSTAWWDPILLQNNLCEGDLPLSLKVIDACAVAGPVVSYLLYLDTNGDGIQETVINSTAPPAAGEVNVGNASNPNFSGGTPTQFDHRSVPVNQKYRFALERLQHADTLTFKLRWNTLDSQGVYVGAKLPHGKHKMVWIVSDSCGNQDTVTTNILLKDCKPPSVLCHVGLSTNIGPSGAAPTLWVTDFLSYAEDNCTPQQQLKYGIRKIGTGTGFPYAEGSITEGNQEVSYGCYNVGFGDDVIEFVEVWAIDRIGNTNYCETYVTIYENNACNGHGESPLFGAIKTQEIEGVEGVTINISSNTNNYLSLLSDVTNSQGYYAFGYILTLPPDAIVQPTLNQDPKNGVTTYDLLLISRHILGLEPLNSPYKMIAADANKSNTITTFDIVELRKLILGIYPELPNNTSWRFVDKSQQFANPQNPFAETIRESIALSDIYGGNYSGGDFVGVKIGDLNLSAQANGLMEADDRSAGTLLFDIETDKKAIEKGEEVTVNFKPSEAQLGYQFTLDLADLEVLEIMPSEGMTQDNFAVFKDAITTSVNDAEGTFAVKFRATKAGDLSKMLSVSSRITPAMAYVASPVAGGYSDVEMLDVALRFRSPAGMTVSSEGFEVYQNVPNPWKEQTTIGFNLPAADHAVLTVYDQLGRTVHTQEGDFAKGCNSFTVGRELVPTAGLLYYKVETGKNSATRKMTQAKR